MLRSVASSLVVLACALLVAGEGGGNASDGNTRDEVALFRNPWEPAASQLGDAHVNMLFLGLRYLLPGAAPSPK